MQKEVLQRYFRGLRDGIPIGLGYLSVSFGFGISAVGEGLRVLEVLLISMTNLTSAGQVAGVTVIVAAGTLFEMFLTQLVINSRYALMGVTLTQRLDGRCTTPHRLLISSGLTDEIFAFLMSRTEPITPAYFYGLVTLPYIGWSGGTLLGALAGHLLPERLRLAMGIILYAMFLAILLPPAMRSRKVLCVVLLAAAFRCATEYLPGLSSLPSGFAVILSALVAALILSVADTVRGVDAGEEEGQDHAR